MSDHNLISEPLHEDIDRDLRRAAEAVACQVAARFYEGDIPSRYHQHVEGVAYELLCQALEAGAVDDVGTWAGEQDLDERVERSLP